MLPCQFHCFSSRKGKPYRSVLKILQTCSRIACAAPVAGIIEVNSVLPSLVGWICQGQDPNPGTPPVCLPLASPWGCCHHLQSWVDQASRSTYPQERMNYCEKRNTEGISESHKAHTQKHSCVVTITKMGFFLFCLQDWCLIFQEVGSFTVWSANPNCTQSCLWRVTEQLLVGWDGRNDCNVVLKVQHSIKSQS